MNNNMEAIGNGINGKYWNIQDWEKAKEEQREPIRLTDMGLLLTGTIPDGHLSKHEKYPSEPVFNQRLYIATDYEPSNTNGLPWVTIAFISIILIIIGLFIGLS